MRRAQALAELGKRRCGLVIGLSFRKHRSIEALAG